MCGPPPFAPQVREDRVNLAWHEQAAGQPPTTAGHIRPFNCARCGRRIAHSRAEAAELLGAALTDETSCCRCGLALEHIDRDLCGAMGDWFAWHASNDLGPGTFGTQIPALVRRQRDHRRPSAREQHPRPPSGHDRRSAHLSPHRPRLLAPPHRQRDGQLVTPLHRRRRRSHETAG
jgi:ribosomal protein L37E